MRAIKWGLCLLALAGILLAACAPTAPAPTPAPAKTEAKLSPTTAAAPAANLTPTPATATSTPRLVKVKYSTNAYVSDAGVFIALEKGYFKEQGIDIEWLPVVGGSDQFALLATGQLDVVGSNVDIIVFTAVQRGINIKLVSDKSSNLAGTRFAGLVVRKDLADQIKTAGDLKGRNVGLVCDNCMGEYQVNLFLKKANLTLADIKSLVLTNPADHLAAFQQKALDVSALYEPFITMAAAQGFGVPWLWVSDAEPGNQGAVLAFGEKLTKDVDAGRRFMVAYLKGVRDYNDAFVKGKNKAEAVQILTKYTSLKDPALYNTLGMPGLVPDGRINISSVELFQDFLIKKGSLKEKVDMSKIIDMQFVDYAVQTLGPYR